jgi:hypothetical protein
MAHHAMAAARNASRSQRHRTDVIGIEHFREKARHRQRVRPKGRPDEKLRRGWNSGFPSENATPL